MTCPASHSDPAPPRPRPQGTFASGEATESSGEGSKVPRGCPTRTARTSCLATIRMTTTLRTTISFMANKSSEDGTLGAGEREIARCKARGTQFTLHQQRPEPRALAFYIIYSGESSLSLSLSLSLDPTLRQAKPSIRISRKPHPFDLCFLWIRHFSCSTGWRPTERVNDARRSGSAGGGGARRAGGAGRAPARLLSQPRQALQLPEPDPEGE